MDEQTQSFLDLSAREDLVQLVADKKAAWLFSADGARVLWANSAGAAFFAAHSVQDLIRLTALERSPARPHIARIAEAGQTDKFSIDRLRFYRGLRVMLLTCQCKRLDLETGEAAALIVCGDKGLIASKDPLTGFAHLLGSETSTVFVSAGGMVVEQLGALTGTPEDLDLPADQSALFGPIELEGTYHEGVVLKVSERQRLIVLDNNAVEDAVADDDLADQPAQAGAAMLAGVAADTISAPTLEETSEAETLKVDEESAWVRADDAEPELDAGPDHLDGGVSDLNTPQTSDQAEEAEPEDAALEEPEAEELPSEVVSNEDDLPNRPEPIEDAPQEEDSQASAGSQDMDADAVAQTDEDAPDESLSEADEAPGAETAPHDASGFVFQPRRRPVRFAWKMDIDQRFTFLSDEFADVLGPEATDIVGQTWVEVAERFDLDPRSQIARALDRRDTWSGKTVDWPVSGAALRVPVDMAALPAFDRNRKFEGYRGFGVCRTADAVPDADSQTASTVPAAAALVADPVDAEPTDQAPSDEEASIEQETPELAEATEAVSETGIEETGADGSGDPLEAPLETRAEETATLDATSETVADTTAETIENAPAPKAEASVDDLKPAQPDSLAGKTFLGASAAALVGSLARFTGKSPQKPQEPAEPETPPAVAATEAEAEETTTDEAQAAASPAETQSADAAADLPGAALDSKLEALQSGRPETADLDETLADTDEEPEATATEAQEDVEDKADSADLNTDTSVTEAAPSQPEAIEATDETSETAEESAEETVAEITGDADVEPAAPSTSSEDAPSGISGPATLAPAEIESAVKSLAKSYKAAEKKSRDLFDEETPAQQDIETAPSAEPEMSADETAEHLADDDTDEDAAATEDSDRAPEERELQQGATEESAEAEDDAIAATTAELDDILQPDAADDEDSIAADEREFFEETAAFETEDQAADAPSETTEPERPTTGEVIPLATVKPRVVPVDTSGLSRPERAAFRKIAEALGARLEGDLEDFDEPEQAEDEPEDELPPEVPEAGPIDPSLLDRLPIGIAIVHDREVLYANKALLAMIGYKSIAKLSQVGGLEALFIDDTEELPDAAGMDGEVDEAMKLRLADGGVLTVDAHMHSVPWNGSRGLMISITERRSPPTSSTAAPASPNFFAEVRSELDNAHSQIAEMDTILETATDGVLVLDQHGTILKVNGSAEALFSANRSDMIGAPFTEFLAPESHRAAADYLDGLSRNGVASILNDGREVLGSVPAGGLIPLFMTMGRISGAEDDAKYCAVLRDITQWKTAEEELTQAKRQAEDASSAKSDFLAKISHEIRTPLNAIIGFSEVMMEERFGPIGNDRYKDYLKDIRTSGSHIMSLVNDLLDLSKIEAGKLDLKFSAVSTSDVINECVALMQPQANRERVIIRASLPEAVPNVVADPRSLRQIVLNLLSNAIKYNRSGGQVILSTALESNGEVALRVRDTGTGMTAKQLTAALEPFRQLHTASRGGGTGLGLPLTKALVEANRASFHIDSTPDQGTLVEIVFPTQRVLAE
ncbi:ATP-binding protein [Roseibium sp.]|uniref:PAS domain-containing sensor histidine kinase n=1 Tax=Roseibium sp. TaxID=1936156 RepID=UPI003BB155A6